MPKANGFVMTSYRRCQDGHINVTFTTHNRDYVYSTAKSAGIIPISSYEANEIIRLSGEGEGVKRFMHKRGIFRRSERGGE